MKTTHGGTQRDVLMRVRWIQRTHMAHLNGVGLYLMARCRWALEQDTKEEAKT